MKRFWRGDKGTNTFSWRKPAGLSPVFGWNFASSNPGNVTFNACLEAGKTAVKEV
jgi:hypothetical protein